MSGPVTLPLLIGMVAWLASASAEEAVSLPEVVVTAPHPVRPPRYQQLTRPAYPEVSRRQGFEGTVVLLVKVLADGRTGEVKVKRSSGDSALDEAAVMAARGWTFLPAMRGPKAVGAWVEIPVKFELTVPK